MNIEEVREALIEWETLSTNKENRQAYEERLKDLRDLLSNMEGYRREGIKIGRDEGIGIGKQEIIKNMMKKGMTLSEVAKLTGLKEDEVKAFMGESK